VRSIASLLLFIHVFCLFVALTSSTRDFSVLQVRLTNAVAPYILFTKVAPNAPYDLTNGTEASMDHFVEVEITSGAQKGEVIRLPQGRVGGSPVQRRLEILARTMGFTSYLGAEQNTAAFAKSLGGAVLSQGDNQEVIVRCKRFEPQARERDTTNPATPDDPTDPAYERLAYQARVWRDRSGQVQLLKIEEKKVVAPLE
jgi:hypothetical protein